jgi:hypothetical protein
MKKVLFLSLIISFTVSLQASANMTLSFTDKGWDGNTVKASQLCQKFGGSGSTPSLKLTDIPEETEIIYVAFNDETYTPMNNGGHGILGFKVKPGSKAAVLPSVPGETDLLPYGVKVIKPHLASDWSGTKGAYLPPCSGGTGNLYTATVMAVSTTRNTILESVKIKLGTY